MTPFVRGRFPNDSTATRSFFIEIRLLRRRVAAVHHSASTTGVCRFVIFHFRVPPLLRGPRLPPLRGRSGSFLSPSVVGFARSAPNDSPSMRFVARASRENTVAVILARRVRSLARSQIVDRGAAKPDAVRDDARTSTVGTASSGRSRPRIANQRISGLGTPSIGFTIR